MNKDENKCKIGNIVKAMDLGKNKWIIWKTRKYMENISRKYWKLGVTSIGKQLLVYNYQVTIIWLQVAVFYIFTFCNLFIVFLNQCRNVHVYDNLVFIL